MQGFKNDKGEKLPGSDRLHPQPVYSKIAGVFGAKVRRRAESGSGSSGELDGPLSLAAFVPSWSSPISSCEVNTPGFVSLAG